MFVAILTVLQAVPVIGGLAAFFLKLVTPAVSVPERLGVEETSAAAETVTAETEAKVAAAEAAAPDNVTSLTDRLNKGTF